MATLAELRAELDEVLQQGQELASRGVDDLSDEDISKLDTLHQRKVEIEEAIKPREEAEEKAKAFAGSRTSADEARMRSGHKLYGQRQEQEVENTLDVSPGEAFVRSSAYAEWMTRFGDGGPANGQSAQSGTEAIEGAYYRQVLGMRSATEKATGGILTPAKMRTLVTSADSSAGLWVRPEFRGLLEPGLVRPLTIRQLVTVLPTQSDAIEYIREASRISAAAPVTEAVQLAHTGDVTATKAEGGLTFETVTDVVKQLALWVPATKRILADAPQLQDYINSYLTDDLAIELEDQIVSGTGGAGFTGLFNTTGTQTLGPPAGALTELDLLRRAKRLIVQNARTRATAILANPEDTERWETIKAGTALNSYALASQGALTGQGDGVPPLWGIPVVESEACPVGFALVGDFRRAILFDREQVNISVGTADQDFIRNIVRVLAEMRAGFGVTRPAAFVEVDLAP